MQSESQMPFWVLLGRNVSTELLGMVVLGWEIVLLVQQGKGGNIGNSSGSNVVTLSFTHSA